MKSTKEAMLPRPTVLKVTDPEVTRVYPAPDEAQPFMLRQHTDEEVADYDKGFECGQKGGPNDDTRSGTWQSGWADAQE
jgi:hypothetical protein